MMAIYRMELGFRWISSILKWLRSLRKKSQVGSPNPHWKKDFETTISCVLGVGISSSLAGPIGGQCEGEEGDH
jgi:hypothetical protein